jgi:hypothetical protein
VLTVGDVLTWAVAGDYTVEGEGWGAHSTGIAPNGYPSVALLPTARRRTEGGKFVLRILVQILAEGGST